VIYEPSAFLAFLQRLEYKIMSSMKNLRPDHGLNALFHGVCDGQLVSYCTNRNVSQAFGTVVEPNPSIVGHELYCVTEVCSGMCVCARLESISTLRHFLRQAIRETTSRTLHSEVLVLTIYRVCSMQAPAVESDLLRSSPFLLRLLCAIGHVNM
jgi:hypothetical protein